MAGRLDAQGESPLSAARLGWTIAAAWLLLVGLPTVTTLVEQPAFIAAHELPALAIAALALLPIVLLALVATAGCAALISQERAKWALGLAVALTAIPVAGALGRLSLPMALAWIASILLAWAAQRTVGRTMLPSAASMIAVVLALGLAASQRGSAEPVTQVLADSPQATSPTNSLLIVLDQLNYPALLDSEGKVRDAYPNLAQFQQSATTYVNAFSAAPFTHQALPSMLRGRDLTSLDEDSLGTLPFDSGQLPLLASTHQILLDSDYLKCPDFPCQTVRPQLANPALLTVADSLAVAGRSQLPAPLRNVFPELEGKWQGYWRELESSPVPPGSDSQAFAADFVRLARGGPVFGLQHSFDTHHPWNRDDQGRPIFGSTGFDQYFAWCDTNVHSCSEPLVETRRQLYLDSVKIADRNFGFLMSALKESGLYDSMSIAITADHGNSIHVNQGDRMPRDPRDIRDEVAHVPLLFKAPQQSSPSTVQRPVSNVQAMGSFLEVNGVDVESLGLISLDRSAVGGAAFLLLDPAERYPEARWPIDVARYQASSVPSRWNLAQERNQSQHPMFEPLPGIQYGQAVDAAQWKQQSDARLEFAAGTSPDLGVIVEADATACGADGQGLIGLLTLNGLAVGTIGWESVEQGDRRRGWAIASPANGEAFTEEDRSKLAVRCASG